MLLNWFEWSYFRYKYLWIYLQIFNDDKDNNKVDNKKNQQNLII
jgi:hypothetical protein